MTMSQSSRTEKWLQQSLRGESEGEIVTKLSKEHVAVVLGAGARIEPQAHLTLSFAVNLLARLFPIVQRLSIIVPNDVALSASVPRWRDVSLQGHIHRFLSALEPPLAWNLTTSVPQTATLTMVVGSGSEAKADVFIGSRGWNAYFSPSRAERTEGAANPVGAYAAASIGTAEIWKRLLAPYREHFPGTPIAPREHRLVFSALTYRQDDDDDAVLPEQIEIGHLTLVGAGAGGGAAAFALASIPGLIGHINAIDPDAVEATNLNRYVFADDADAKIERLKVSVIEELFDAHSRVTVNPVPEAFGAAAPKLETSEFRQVLAAVHSREARREIQSETPMVLWDCGAAQHGEFRIWRMVLEKSECMYCKHPKNAADAELRKAQQLQALLGLDASIWLRKMKDHESFTQEDIATIAAHISVDAVAFSLPREGERFNDWEAAQCGRISLPEIDDEVPIPFAPVMAGVLIAGEVLKEIVAPSHRLDASYENTLMGAFSAHRRPERRLPRADCAFCRDPINVRQYRRRWV